PEGGVRRAADLDLVSLVAGARVASACAHQVDEVVAVEALPRPLARPRHGRLEAADRISPAFDVRVVGREHADILAGLLDDPADGLGRVGRGADLAADVLARAERELPEPLLGISESLVRGVELQQLTRHIYGAQLDDAELES